MTLAILVAVFLGTIAYEVPGLVRNKEWRELIAFSCFMFLAMSLSFAEALDLPLPNPNKGLEMIFNPVSKIIYKVLS